MKSTIIFILFMLVVSTNTHALCEGRLNTEFDLMFSEKDFTKEKYQSNLKYLNNFYSKFRDIKDVSQAKSFETWIGYRNSLLLVEGFVLKQAAEITNEAEDVSKFCGFINANTIDH